MSFIGTKGGAANVFAPPSPMAQLFINRIREVAKPPAKNCRRHVGSWPIVLKKSIDVADHIRPLARCCIMSGVGGKVEVPGARSKFGSKPENRKSFAHTGSFLSPAAFS